jgi:hypothetical protein
VRALLLAALLAVCPPYGKTNMPPLRALNRLKNRTAPPATYRVITIAQLAAAPRGAFSESTGVSVKGLVRSVKREGPESCNCYSATATDWHIVLSDGVHEVVTEITPRVPCAVPKVGTTVVAKGWLFYDLQHVLDRPCVWEVHPVFSYR